jgi:membrane protein
MTSAALRSLLRRTWHAFQQDHCTLLAAGIAYYALFSFIPLATLMLALLGFVVRDPASRQLALDRILLTLPLQAGEGQNLVLDSLRSVSAQAGALSITGFLGLFWTASGMFDAIRTSLHVAWKVTPAPSFFRDRVRDACAVAAVGLLLIVSMAGTVVVHLPPLASLPAGAAVPIFAPRASTLVGVLGTLLITYAGFALTYRHVPNVRHGFRDVWPGALLATLLFEMSKHAFVVYAGLSAGSHELYGLLGGVMLFMLWTYTAGIIVLIGAEFTCEYERSRITPAPAAAGSKEPAGSTAADPLRPGRARADRS